MSSLIMANNGNTLPIQRITSFRSTDMKSRPTFSKTQQTTNQSYLQSLKVKKEITNTLAQKNDLALKQQVVEPVRDNRTLAEQENDEVNIDEAFNKLTISLVKGDPKRVADLQSRIKKRDYKSFIQVSPQIEKELQNYKFAPASLIENIFKTIKAKTLTNNIYELSRTGAQGERKLAPTDEANPTMASTEEASKTEKVITNTIEPQENQDDAISANLAAANENYLNNLSAASTTAEQARQAKMQTDGVAAEAAYEQRRQVYETAQAKKRERAARRAAATAPNYDTSLLSPAPTYAATVAASNQALLQAGPPASPAPVAAPPRTPASAARATATAPSNPSTASTVITTPTTGTPLNKSWSALFTGAQSPTTPIAPLRIEPPKRPVGRPATTVAVSPTTIEAVETVATPTQEKRTIYNVTLGGISPSYLASISAAEVKDISKRLLNETFPKKNLAVEALLRAKSNMLSTPSPSEASVPKATATKSSSSASSSSGTAVATGKGLKTKLKKFINFK